MQRHVGLGVVWITLVLAGGVGGARALTEAAHAHGQSSGVASPQQTPSGVRIARPPMPTRTYRGTEEVPEPLRVEALEAVWGFVDSSYWDPTFNGVDWNAVRSRYLPLARQASVARDLHRVLNDMLGELKVSHMRVIEASGPVPVAEPVATTTATLGLVLHWIEGRVIVTGFSREYSSPPGQVRPGDEVTSIDGRSVEQAYQAYRSNERGFVFKEAAARIVALRPSKPIGSTVDVELRGTDGTTRRASLPVKASTAHEAPIEVRSVDGCAHIAIRVFAGDDFVARWKEAWPALVKARGWVLDLRGNRGGRRDYVMEVASTLFRESTSLGESRLRQGVRPETVPAGGASAYTGPVVVLVDEFSGSSSEVLSGGLQSVGRAKVVGRATIGGVLPSVRVPLPTGAMLQAAIAEYRTARGQVLEGVGVTPDIEVLPARADAAAGRDAALLAALALLSSSGR